jgi:hypothetical protein
MLCLLALVGGQAGAQAPAPSPIVSFQMLVRGAVGEKVLDIRGAPSAAGSEVAPVTVTGGLKISPRLCVRAYHLDFVFTRQSGAVVDVPLTATVNSARLDRRAAHCPFSGLPAGGLSSLRVSITANARPLMNFDARPLDRTGAVFGQLAIPTLRYDALTSPLGNDRIRVEAHYRGKRIRVVTLSVEVAPATPAPT